MTIIDYVWLGVILLLLPFLIVVFISYHKHGMAAEAWKLAIESCLSSGELDQSLINLAAIASADADLFDRRFRFAWRMKP